MRVLFFLFALGCWSGAAAAAPDCDKDEKTYRPSAPTISATPLALAITGFDRDGDLAVSRSEYEIQARSSFARSDRDGDGQLSLIEFSGWAESMLGNSGALPGPFDFDKDGDDRISGSEFEAEFGRRFEMLDKNDDQSLSRSELLVFVDAPFRDRRGRNRCEPRRARMQPQH